MNKKTILTWLIIAMIAVSGCGSGAPTGPTATESPVTESPQTEVPANGEPAASIEGELQAILAYTLPVTDNPENWTIPIRVAPFKAIKDYQYKFPEDWPQDAGTPVEVGVVEIGPGPEKQGTYLAAIDIVSAGDTVPGLLASTTNADVFLVFFQRTTQKLNPARGEEATIEAFKTLPPPPDVAVAIRSDSLCFVVKTNNDPPYIRYCSEPKSMLSVKDNFASQYASVQSSMNGAIELLMGGGNFEPGFAAVQTEQIISEMEDPSRLEGCGEQILNPAQVIQPPEPTPTKDSMTFEFEPPQDAAVPDQPKPSLAFSQSDTLLPENLAVLQAACGSDITVAPVTLDYFQEKYQSLAPPASSRLFMVSLLAPAFLQAGTSPITVAAVQIHQPIDTSLGTVFPGNYRLDYWFNAGGEFYAATITGTLTNGTPVTNQPVPAVPATFVNEDDTEQPGAQISTCRIFGRCTFFQSSCS